MAYDSYKRGWGSIPVNVTLNKTTWKTSIFSSKKMSAYILPLKAEVRKKEKIDVGNVISITIEIIS